MTTIEKLIAQARQSIAEKLKARATKTKVIEDVRAACLAENRDPSDAESEQVRTAVEERTAIDAEVDQLQAREAELVTEQERDDAANSLHRQFTSGADLPGYDDVHRVGEEEHTYRLDGDHSFFRDMFASQMKNNPAAGARLERHTEEVTRDAEKSGKKLRAIGTGNVGGLVPPQFLVDLFAPELRNGRPFANAVRRLPLPDEGMVFTIPRGNTGSAVAPQATQNTAVQNTDLDWNNDLTINVRTYAGEQDVARQLLERGSPGMDQLIYADLTSAYATALDVAIINSDGTAGTHKGVLHASGTNSVTYTDASPTVPEAWSKLASAKGQVGANRKLPMNLWVMTTMRWAWFIAALDSANRPLIVDDPTAAINAMGASVAENFGEGQLVGTVQGTPVLVDDNLPVNLGGGTNQDDIIGLRASDLLLWEENDGMPMELLFEQTKGSNLTVTIVVYGYSGFTAERYGQAVSIISGTGLVAPTL